MAKQVELSSKHPWQGQCSSCHHKQEKHSNIGNQKTGFTSFSNTFSPIHALQYMLSNTFFQTIKYPLAFQYLLVLLCSRLQSCKGLRFQSAPLFQDPLLCWFAQPRLQSGSSFLSCSACIHHHIISAAVCACVFPRWRRRDCNARIL